MIIKIPDDPVLADMGESENRIHLACEKYAASHSSLQGAVDVAGVSRYDFEQASTKLEQRLDDGLNCRNSGVNQDARH